jgi:hypothetical protein
MIFPSELMPEQRLDASCCTDPSGEICKSLGSPAAVISGSAAETAALAAKKTPTANDIVLRIHSPYILIPN